MTTTETNASVHKTASLGGTVFDAFIRYIMRPDVSSHIDQIAKHYRTSAAGVAMLALPGFVATVVMRATRREPTTGDDDMPAIARMFLRGARLHTSRVVDDILSNPSATPAEISEALIERFLRHADVLDHANVRVGETTGDSAPTVLHARTE